MLALFTFIKDSEVSKYKGEILKLRYDTERVEDNYFVTPLSLTPLWASLHDYDVKWDNSTGEVTGIHNK